MTTATRSSNSNGHKAVAAGAVRQLKSGAPAHTFSTEERRRGAERTNEIKRERAAKRREAKCDPLDLAEQLLLLKADRMLCSTPSTG